MESGSVVLNRYLLQERIGAGGAGVVWKATDQHLHQTVALKRVHVTGSDDDQAQRTRVRALREAQLAAKLRGHPHVVAVYDVHADDGDIWLVMEYVPARTLREILRSRGALDPAEVARIGVGIADALAAGHDLGIEHRDVKPGNVLITDDGRVKLGDYGISHLTGDPQLTQTGISGTPAYLAPEVARNGECSPASDVFSLGATLYAAVEDQPPFGTDENTYRLLNVVRTGIIRAPTKAGPLEPILLRLLQPQPSTRPDTATARDQLAQLAERLGGGTGAHARAALPGPPAWRPRWPPRRSVVLSAAVVVALAVATVAVVTLTDTPGMRTADPCSLVDLTDLNQFGTTTAERGPFPQSCDVSVDTPEQSHDVHVEVELRDPGSDPGGQSREVGNVTVHDKGLVDYAGTTGCQVWITRKAEQPTVTITSYIKSDEMVSLCTFTSVALNSALEKYEPGDIGYDPDQIAQYSFADVDTCTLLGPAEVGSVPDLIPAVPDPGFGNWSCRWGSDGAGNRISLRFELREDSYLDEELGTPSEIAGKAAYTRGSKDACGVYVLHHPGAVSSNKNEVLYVGVLAPKLPESERCAVAEKLAEAAETRLA